MATLLLQAAGAALTSALGPVGMAVGKALGALAGSVIDNALFGGSAGPAGRLATARIPGPDEGSAIPRLYGTARIGGSLIWATRFEESVSSDRQGGKGGHRTETYDYRANIALALCDGPIAGVRRVFADGRELPMAGLEMRVHTGTRSQLPDPLIEAKQGKGRAPAYRGLAYVVFEALPLKDFGNRIPVLQFEVMRPVGTLEGAIRAVTLIPGATEHGYNPVSVSESIGEGATRTMNRNTLSGSSDWMTSLDELTALCPALERVALVVSWFGTSLDAAACAVLPGVEVTARTGESAAWSVSGITREGAHLISRSGAGPAFGGTPSDASVTAAIADLKRRGLKVFLYPFLMMDVPAGNSLADPYGGARQAAYPWRGRITCLPAPGRSASPDGTAAVRAVVDRFHGSDTADDFSVDGRAVSYRGSGTGYARMILHYALLARAAGGVDGFIIGSELRGLTTLRDEANAFPFVGKLVGLAAQVRAILGSGTALTYGADWSEYFGHQPGPPAGSSGPGPVFFHLDPLWASPAIDAVGIDNYMPLADFRDADLAAAQPDGFRHADDPQALERQITAGERFDWYYASDADRRAGRRTPITDGAAGKPWVFAPKDIAGWWSNRHYDRPDGREAAKPTAWVPRMKPVWFTEIGCPAIDRGGNQPNVFLDPKSSESFAPWFSRGHRSDSAQRRFLEAHLRHWQARFAADGMVDPGHIFLWCWDARPFPAFPQATATWSDGANWQTGHWLNGRLGAGTAADVIAAILTDHGFADFDVTGVTGDLIGYIKGETSSARQLLEPLLQAFGIDVVEHGAVLRFTSRHEASLPPVPLEVVADLPDAPLYRDQRAKAEDFPDQALITHDDPARAYELTTARSRRMAGAGDRLIQLAPPAVLDAGLAGRLAEALLRDQRLQRRSVSFQLPPTALALEPGDVIRLPSGPAGRFLVTRIEDGAARRVEAREFAPAISPTVPLAETGPRSRTDASAGFDPAIVLLDLPRFEDGAAGSFARAAVLVKPWRPVSISTSPGSDGYRFRALADRPASLGTLAAPLSPGTVLGRFDNGRVLTVDLGFGAPASALRRDVLAGANRVAVAALNGAFEIIGFATAEEVAPGRFALRGLLNGLSGTADAMAAGAAQFARVVMLDGAPRPLDLAENELGLGLNYVAEGTGLAGGRTAPQRFAGGLRAETPLAPVHLRAGRVAGGAIRIRWIRCGRIDADRWEATDIPLDEAQEAWRIELMDAAGTVRASLTSSTTTIDYAPERERADFGGPQTQLSLRIRQLGRRVPSGLPASAVLTL